jgi:hypothetical protein
MAASFKAQKIRTSAIIGSGSFVGSRPSILIYSASVADVNGDLTDTGVYSKVGKDAFLFVSGTVGGKGTTGVSAFGGDVVISGTIYNASGTPYSVSGGSPDGSNKQIQFNDAGSFRGDGGLLYDKNTATLTVGNLVVTGAITTITTSNLVVSDPLLYIASGSTSSNTNGGIAIASGSSVAHQALVWGRVANNTWGAGRLDVTGGTVTDLTSMNLVAMRAASLELGGNVAYVSSSASDRLVLYGSNVQVTGSLFGSSTASFAGNVTGSNALFSGDLALNGGKITSTAATITVGGSSNIVAAGGDLRLDTNIIKASGNATAITLTSANVAVAGSLTVNGFNIVGGASSLAVGDTTATVTTAGQATTYTVGGTSASTDATFSFAPTRTGNVTFNVASGGTTSGKTKTVNIGSGGTAGTTEVRIGTAGGTSSTFITGAMYVSSSQGTAATFFTGISGSLTRLSNGTSFLAAGSNVTISTGSTGQITISSTGGSGSPGGSTTQVQFNDGGSFSGSPGMVYAKAQELLSVGSLSVTGSSLVVTGTVGILVPETASSFTIRSVGSPQVPFFSLDTDGIGIGFGGNPIDSYEFNKLRGGDSDRVLFLSGGSPTSPDIRSATDVNFFVSGSIGSKGLLQGTSVFGGDTVVSGALYIGDATATTSRRLVTMGRAEITGSTYITGSTSLLGVGKVELSTDSSNDFYLNNTLPGKLSYFGVTTTEGVTTNFLRVRPNSVPQNTLVSFLQSLGGHNTVTPIGQTDTNFFVGGAIGSMGGATRGTAVFAGDMVISGSTSHENNVTMKADILPDGNRTRNLGSPNLRWANVYTGDLHLRNERGDYTLIEEEDCLTIRFNKNGKRYRFLLERAPEFDEDPPV